MKRAGLKRRRVMASLVPAGAGIVVDVGADHGHVARALGAIATERMPNRMRRLPGDDEVAWVVADGLLPFRRVDVAVIGGMGALTIAGILERGPRPSVAVLHAQDDPPRLRLWLAEHGWRIEEEALAPEAGRYAEILRAVPGEETSAGLALELGPRLLEGTDPYLIPHLEQLAGWLREVVLATEGRAADKHARAAERLTYVEGALKRRR
ncbi:MAG: tRNA (adenine(22)-N(1))-methyltransferase TrmK [Alphaproteobacteria bacterium]|nr:tRNA (adenine(22)-N(1))-methyltransferase TrmK [Alphaproteobacteria bacterium]